MFNAIHMALMPKGVHRGKVLAWDWDIPAAVPNPYKQRWTILDPKTKTFTDKLLTVTSGRNGDPMCAGHAWNADGDLVVAGGNRYTLNAQNQIELDGHEFVWSYKPDLGSDGTWQDKEKMAAPRWYPMVTLLANGRMMFSGGWKDAVPHQPDLKDHTYELYDPFSNQYDSNPNGSRYGSNKLFYGPGINDAASKLSAYPRMHLLPYGSGQASSWGMVFMSGHGEDSARVNVDLVLKTMETWFYPSGGGWHNSPFKHHHDGSSFLYPNLDVSLVNENTVVRLGGEVEDKATSTKSITDTVQWCVAGANPTAWANLPNMSSPREHCNAVLLPDGSYVVIGGTKNVETPSNNPDPVMNAELYVPGSPQGRYVEPDLASSRVYHSTALLLPSGKVLSAGGEYGWLIAPKPGGRSWDFQVFVPDYMQGQNRPTILSAPTQITFLDAQSPHTYKVYYSYPWDDYNVTKVVLMAPGSVTHHSDSSQRYVECVVAGSGSDGGGQYIEIYPPLKIGDTTPIGSHAPPGYYMLFVLTDNTGETWRGVPSEAAWVKLQ